MKLTKTQPIFAGTLILCAIFFSISLSTSAQTVNIPDANLRKAINEALGNQAPNARITADEMNRLIHLEANVRDIKNLAQATVLAISDLKKVFGAIAYLMQEGCKDTLSAITRKEN